MDFNKATFVEISIYNRAKQSIKLIKVVRNDFLDNNILCFSLKKRYSGSNPTHIEQEIELAIFLETIY
jgi:hypothetical protein